MGEVHTRAKIIFIEMIAIKKINEVYVKLNCSNSIAEDISNYFTFFAPNYQFSPMYKKRVWDGKIRLFNKKNFHFYIGLLDYLSSFCKERDIKLVVDDALVHDNGFRISDAEEFADSLNLHSYGKQIKAYDDQIRAVTHAIRNERSVLLSPTASGKSLIIYIISRYLLASECKHGLLVVPTVSLVEQMYNDFKDYSSKNGWNVDSKCKKVYAGQDKTEKKELTISTWQSIYDQPKEYFEQFDFIIGDEAHTFKAQSLAQIMTSLINAKYRIGTTGTIDDVKVHKLTLEAYFGPVQRITTTKELIDKNRLSQFEIKCLILKYPPEICTQVKNYDYQKEIDFIVTNQVRNNYIANLALSLEGNTLILFQFVEKHGKILHAIIEEKIKDNRKVFFISGETEVEIRDSVRHITEKENNAIIVASYGTFSTGVSIRNLHNIIFASPSKSKIRNLQSIGRGLRLGDNKKKAVLYDIVDDLRTDAEDLNFAMKHYIERMKIYHQEKFKISTYKVGLEYDRKES